MSWISKLFKNMSTSFYGNATATSSSISYDALVTRVVALESLNDGLSYLKNHEVSFAEILTKLDGLCAAQNQQTAILADLQSRINTLETGGTPSIITVGPAVAATP